MKSLLLRLGVLGIGLLIGGIVILAGNAADRKAIANGVGDINTMSASDFAAGNFVQGDITLICDEFAFLEEYNSTFGIKSNERVSKHYYVVPLVGNTTEYDQFIAIEVGNEEMVSTAEKMIDEFWQYVDNSDSSVLTTSMPFQGKIVKMQDELSDYMYEWFTYMYTDLSKEDMATLTCPYVVQYVAPDYEKRGSTGGVIVLLLGVLFTGIAAFFFVKGKKDAASAAQADMPAFGSDAVSVDPYNPTLGAKNDQDGTIGSQDYRPVGSETTADTVQETPQDAPWEK